MDRFTLGSDLGNYFVLSADPASKNPLCYINIYHCQLFPDPDFSDIWLHNSSTSQQTVRRWPLSLDTRFLSPLESSRLGAGVWILRLGEGLLFLLRVFSVKDVDGPSTHTSSTFSGIPVAPDDPSRRVPKDQILGRKLQALRKRTAVHVT